MAGRLSARFAATVTSPGRHGDGNGLYLLVKPSGTKSWVLRTVVQGRRCNIGLGGYPLVSLAETARRVRQRISAVMRWLVAQAYRADNPAGGAIAAALPNVGDTRRHFRALHHTEAVQL